MQTALTAVIALLSLSLVSSFLDKETFEHYFQRKGQRRVVLAYMVSALALLVCALVLLPFITQAENYYDVGGWTKFVYLGSVIIAGIGFGLQAMARYETMKKNGKKTRTKSIKSLRLQRPRTARRSRPKS